MATKRTRNPEPVAFVDDGLGNSSYLVDLGAGLALVVDPARHPGGYMAEAQRRGLDIAFAVETHLHADFVSGARELGALGATLLVPGTAGHGFAVRGVADGEEVDLGGLKLRGLATPGHTPGHQSVVIDGTDGNRTIVCCQAAWDVASFDASLLGDDGWDEHAGTASLRRLHALHPDRVLLSHDQNEWHVSH